MWIRSQGGNILMDCDSFAVEDHSGKYEVIILNCRTSISVSLGMYSTKEKALKVLDEIQKRTEYLYTKVFQMPQDWEVEV
jgi:hypothetical protein